MNDAVLDLDALLAQALETEIDALRAAGPDAAPDHADLAGMVFGRRPSDKPVLRRPEGGPAPVRAVPPDVEDRQAQARAFRKRLSVRPSTDDPADANDLPPPWPADWFETRDPNDWARCRRMWGQVLWYSVDDALCDRIKGRPLRPILISRDFFDVAALVGLDGQAVAERILAQVHSVADAHAMRARLRRMGAA